jgi:hypothetical protein
MDLDMIVEGNAYPAGFATGAAGASKTYSPPSCAGVKLSDDRLLMCAWAGGWVSATSSGGGMTVESFGHRMLLMEHACRAHANDAQHVTPPSSSSFMILDI